MADIIREYNRLRREEMRTSDPVRLEEIRKEMEYLKAEYCEMGGGK